MVEHPSEAIYAEGMQIEAPHPESSRARTWAEIVIVLALSLGASALYSLVSFIDKATRETALSEQASELNRTLAERPAFDLTYQLLGIVLGLAPVALVIFLTWQRQKPHLAGLGITELKPSSLLRDAGGGVALAAAVGIPGIGLYVIARILGLPFPGGPWIDKTALGGDPGAIAFPRGLTAEKDQAKHRFDYSFSGLKTAVARWIERAEREGGSVPVADVAASFQEAVVDVLTRKALDACAHEGIEHLLIGGGVAANSRLRALVNERAAKVGVEVRIPSPRLCTDNGAMVASLGAQLVQSGIRPSAIDFPVDSSLPITTASL